MINENLAAVMIKQKRKLKVISLNIKEIPNGYALIKMNCKFCCENVV